MVIEGYAYSRYVDDIRIVCETDIEAKRALAELDRRLRNLGLNLQSAKTQIYPREDAMKLAENIETKLGKKRAQAVAELMEDLDPYVAEELTEEEIEHELSEELRQDAVQRFYKDVIQRPREHDLGDLKFCLSYFRKTHDPVATDGVIRRLVPMPFLSDAFGRYLSVFAEESHIRAATTKFLESQANIYAWQEMWLLYVLFKKGKPTIPERRLLRKIAGDRNKHFACRNLAILTLGKNGDASDLDLLKSLYSLMEPVSVRKAIILALRKLPKSSRMRFYRTHEGDHDEIAQVVRYVKERTP